MTVANHPDAFRHCIGRKIIGVLFDALPINRKDLATGNKSLVFENGEALTFSSSGAYWIDSKVDVARAIGIHQRELEQTKTELEDLLRLAGELT